MKAIGVGVIGWGFMGKTHTQALRNIALFYPGIDFQVKLKCICSRRLEKAAEAAQLAGFESYTDDYRELLAREDIDVVSICTPNAQHEEMAIAAMKAGKHVYIDKPLSVTGESAGRIAKVADEAGVFTQMVFNNRFVPSSLRAKQLIEEGKIGEVLTFNVRYLHSGSIDPNRPIGWKQQKQGGVLLDLGSHALDLLTWMIGYPDKVFCKMHTLYNDRPTREGGRESILGEDHIAMMLEMPNGAIGAVEASKIATGTNDELSLEIRGTKGALKWNSMDVNYVYYYDQTLPEAPYGGMRGFTQIESVARYPAPGGAFLPPKNSVGWDRGHLHCYYTFLNCVAHGIRPENSIQESAHLQRFMDRVRQSAELEKWVNLED